MRQRIDIPKQAMGSQKLNAQIAFMTVLLFVSI